MSAKSRSYSALRPDLRQHRMQDASELHTKTATYWHAVRRWMAHLSPPEFKVALFILDRTTQWDEPKTRFTRSLISRGDGLQCGTGLSENRITEILPALEERGLIEVDRSDVNRGMIITLNRDWNPDGSYAASHPKTLTGVSIERTFRHAFDSRYGSVGGMSKPWNDDLRRDAAAFFESVEWPPSRTEELHAFIEWAVRSWVAFTWPDGVAPKLTAKKFIELLDGLLHIYPPREEVFARRKRELPPATPSP